MVIFEVALCWAQQPTLSLHYWCDITTPNGEDMVAMLLRSNLTEKEGGGGRHESGLVTFSTYCASKTHLEAQLLVAYKVFTRILANRIWHRFRCHLK